MGLSSHQFSELVLLLSIIGVPLLVRLVKTRPPLRTWLKSPIWAVVTLGIGAIAWIPVRLWILDTGGRLASRTLTYVAGLLFFLALGVAASFVMVPPEFGGVAHKRGTRIESGKSRQRAGALARRRGRITIAGIPLDPRDETKHIKIIGTTGTGKSTAIREIISAALARGDRVIIADPDGGYLSRFYDPAMGDKILNPFDARSARWDVFGEIRQPFDVEQLARALIPDGPGDDRSWRHYARVFFSSVARQQWELGLRDPQGRTVPELYRALTRASSKELAVLLDGTAAVAYLDEGNEKMFGSVRSVTATFVAALDYLSGCKGPAMTIRDWVRPPDGSPPSRALFLPYSAVQIASLRSTISAWLRLAIFEAMNGPEQDPDDPRRLWIIIDELDALGAIDGLKDALTRLRKFGGCVVIGFQSISQVCSVQGEDDAQTSVENCGTTLVLRCSASDQGGTARFASRLIGDREVIRKFETRSRRSGEWRTTTNSGEQHVTEAAVLPSEIEQLPDLQGYLKLASSPIWLTVRLSHHDLPKRAEPIEVLS